MARLGTSGSTIKKAPPPPPTKALGRGTPQTRAELREIKLKEIRAKATAAGALEKSFPTATPMNYELHVSAPTMHLDLTDPGDIQPAFDIKPTEQQEWTLATLATEINKRISLAARLDNQAADHRLAAAIRLAEASNMCNELRIPFKKWAQAHITGLAENTVYQMVVVGRSPDPRQAMAEWRDKNAVANRQLRARKAEEKKTLIDSIGVSSGAGGRADGNLSSRAPAALPWVAAEEEHRAALPRPPMSNPDATVDAILRAMTFLDTQARRAVADAAALRLEAAEARAHVETVAEKLGLHVTRDGSNNFFVTKETLLVDFGRLEPDDQASFIRRAAENIGALVECP